MEKSGSGALVKLVSETNIFQAAPAADPYIHFFSNLDLTFDNNFFYAQIVFLFRAGVQPHEVPNLILGLQSSASKLLDEFPMLAGRMCKDESNRTAVLVNNAGIPFYHADCSARLSDWEELRHCDIDVKLNPANKGIADIQAAPLIRLQVTRFQDGGIAIGFSAMHIAVDGTNVIDVIKSWGEIHRGVPLSKPPSFATHLLKAREPPRITHPLPDNLSFFDHDMDLDFIAAATGGGDDGKTKKKKLARHTFKMESSAVDELIREIESGPHKYGRVSSYEAVAALFWTCVCRARSGSNRGTSHFTIPVSIIKKGRFDPELPEGYFGNSSIMTLATATTEELVDQHMSLAAKLVHKRSQSYVPEMAKSVIDQLEMRLRDKKPLAIAIGDGPPSGRDVLSTSLASFPVYQIEFGFGKLEQCIFSFPLDIGEGLICSLPVPSGGRGRHIAMCLAQEHMDKLLEDPIFCRYVIY